MAVLSADALPTSGAPRRVLLIVNPASRRGARLHEIALGELRALGADADAVLTERSGHAADIARTLGPSYDVVLTLGGDGTAMEVIGALSPTRVPNAPPVGVLPGGTGNLLARAFGVPLGVRRAVRALLAGDVIRIDLGCIHTRAGQPTPTDHQHRFAIAAGVGVDASMVAETPAHWKRRVGIGAYVVFAARALLRGERFTTRITADDQTVTRRASAVMVVNIGSLLNNWITLGDGIQYDDGVLNVCVFDPKDLGSAIRIFRKLLFRDFSPDPDMTYLAGRRIIVETDPPRMGQADGELLGLTPLEIHTEPRAGALLVPQEVRRASIP